MEYWRKECNQIIAITEFKISQLVIGTKVCMTAIKSSIKAQKHNEGTCTVLDVKSLILNEN